jgi:hypothetical protein
MRLSSIDEGVGTRWLEPGELREERVVDDLINLQPLAVAVHVGPELVHHPVADAAAAVLRRDLDVIERDLRRRLVG